MRIKSFVTMLILATAALATTACASTGNMSDDNDAPRAERTEREQPRVPSGFY